MVDGKGGKDLKNKNRDLPLNEQAMKGMSYMLRHAAGTLNVQLRRQVGFDGRTSEPTNLAGVLGANSLAGH